MHSSDGLIRAFLDTNVLISASLTANSRFLNLWRMVEVRLLTSEYVVAEARRNFSGTSTAQFDMLLGRMQIHRDVTPPLLPAGINLVEKDRPILVAALLVQADYLLTGDKNHFSHLYGRRIQNIVVIPPATFLDKEEHRIQR